MIDTTVTDCDKATINKGVNDLPEICQGSLAKDDIIYI